MCIVVDPPLFLAMFKADNPDHLKYLPVRQWVDRGLGKFVIGGSMYQKELHGVRSIIHLLHEYERKGRVVKNAEATVDAEVAAVRAIEPTQDFDDPHLVALIRVTGCRLICVNDPRSHKFLRDSRFYVKLKDRPKLYTRAKNNVLLCNSNIGPCCK